MEKSKQQRCEYAFHRGVSTVHPNGTKAGLPVVPIAKVKRNRDDTRPFSKEELAKVRQFEPARRCGEYGTTFDLYPNEIQFIEERAKLWNVPYEYACAKVIHDALGSFQKVLDLVKNYNSGE